MGLSNFRKKFFRKTLPELLLPEWALVTSRSTSSGNPTYSFRNFFLLYLKFMLETSFYCFSSLKTSQKMQKILINAYLRRIGRTTTNKTSNTEHLLHGDHQIFKCFTGPPMESAKGTTTESNNYKPKRKKESREGRRRSKKTE